MSDPTPIPARIAYRLCAAVLQTRACSLRGRTAGSVRRRGPSAGENSRAKQPGRDAVAGRHEHAADRLHSAASDPAAAKLPGVDAAVLGYLLAYLAGWMDARRELEAELAELGRADALKGVMSELEMCLIVIGGDE